MFGNILRNYVKILVVDGGNVAKQAIFSSKLLGLNTASVFRNEDDLEYLELADETYKIDDFSVDSMQKLGETGEFDFVFSTIFDDKEMEVIADEYGCEILDNSFAIDESLNRNMIEVTQLDREVQGLTVRWDDGQFVVIVCPAGLVGCGAIDNEVLEKFGFAVTISQGTPDHPLVVPEDLLSAKVMRLTSKAEELGISVGMSGGEALELMKK